MLTRNRARAIALSSLIILTTALCTPVAQAAENGDLTAGERSCLQRLLTASDLAKVLAGAEDPALRAKAKSCRGATSAGRAVTPATSGSWITANPLDLTHVVQLSPFRSCAGHDYSGRNIAGQAETDRSMKHYVVTNTPWSEHATVKGYAPFAGIVSTHSERLPLGKQLQITSPTLGWKFVFFHGEPLIKDGARVKAGQAVIAWPPAGAQAFEKSDSPQARGFEFDIALVSVDGRYESPLLHMTPAVRAAWAARGFTAANSIISKQERDAAPCNGVFGGF
ncbi:MAG: hypothetical protein Q7K25_00120 [Actinomycetota bacterium]|nr:hypothetical protein [Actinomycetota bacterium]